MTAYANRERLASLAYVRSIVAGLVPSDETFETIHASVEKHGGLPLEARTGDQLLAMVGDIRRIRNP